MASNHVITVSDELKEELVRSVLNALPPLRLTFSQPEGNHTPAIGQGTPKTEAEQAEKEKWNQPGPSTGALALVPEANRNGRTSDSSTPVKRKVVFDSLPLTPSKKSPGPQRAEAQESRTVLPSDKSEVLIAKILWKSFKTTPIKEWRLLEITFMDQEHNQFAGVAYKEMAIKMQPKLVKDHIYEISGFFKENKTADDVIYSRLKDQKFKVTINDKTRFTDITATASKWFPPLQMKFDVSYHSITEKPVCNIIGWVIESNLMDENLPDDSRRIVVRNQWEETIDIDVSKSFNEIKHLEIAPNRTILALLGIEAGNGSELHAKTFQDSIIKVIFSIDYTSQV